MTVVNPAPDVPLVTELPATPVDGQMIDFLADAANGIHFRLRYRAASPSAYKWESVGGGSLFAEVATTEGSNISAYGDLASVGPAITLPLAGDYDVAIGMHGIAAISDAVLMSYDIGATPAADSDAVRIGRTAGDSTPGTRPRRKTGLAAGAALTAKYRTAAGNASTFQNRWIRVTPVRVG